MIELARLLDLEPEDERKLNPHALERINAWEARILRRTRQLDIQEVITDLDSYLGDNEMVEFDRCLADIRKWLSACMEAGSKYFLHPYATWVIDPMLRVESLILKAYQKAEAEREKKEREDRWCAAFVSINPPIEDAKKYLSEKEYNEFTLAVEKAIDAYLGEGEAYVHDPRALEYRRWLERIEERKERQAHNP